MKRTKVMLPNDKLRGERQRRGWSREYVAEQIGIADPKTLGRWERGDSSPNAFFLQKLCDLFAMLPQDLGLYHEKQQQAQSKVAIQTVPDQADREETLSHYTLTIPTTFTRNEGDINREMVLEYLKQYLLASDEGKNRPLPHNDKMQEHTTSFYDDEMVRPGSRSLTNGRQNTLTVELTREQHLLEQADEQTDGMLVIFLPLRRS